MPVAERQAHGSAYAARIQEQLAEMLSRKYNIEYVDLTSKAIDTDALRLVSEAESKQSEVAPFHKVNKQLYKVWVKQFKVVKRWVN